MITPNPDASPLDEHASEVAANRALHDRLAMLAGDLSFKQLGRLTGINAESVRRYMGGSKPSVDFIVAMCRAADVSADWLLFGTGRPRPWYRKVQSTLPNEWQLFERTAQSILAIASLLNEEDAPIRVRADAQSAAAHPAPDVSDWLQPKARERYQASRRKAMRSKPDTWIDVTTPST